MKNEKEKEKEKLIGGTFLSDGTLYVHRLRASGVVLDLHKIEYVTYHIDMS